MKINRNWYFIIVDVKHALMQYPYSVVMGRCCRGCFWWISKLRSNDYWYDNIMVLDPQGKEFYMGGTNSFVQPAPFLEKC